MGEGGGRLIGLIRVSEVFPLDILLTVPTVFTEPVFLIQPEQSFSEREELFRER